MKCQLSENEKIQDGGYGNSPCDLCGAIQEISKEVGKLKEQYDKTIHDLKQLPAMKAYVTAKNLLADIERGHKKCAGCGLCFGGNHIAFNYHSAIGDVCQWCEADIKKQGVETFKKRMKGGVSSR